MRNKKTRSPNHPKHDRPTIHKNAIAQSPKKHDRPTTSQKNTIAKSLTQTAIAKSPHKKHNTIAHSLTKNAIAQSLIKKVQRDQQISLKLQTINAICKI